MKKLTVVDELGEHLSLSRVRETDEEYGIRLSTEELISIDYLKSSMNYRTFLKRKMEETRTISSATSTARYVGSTIWERRLEEIDTSDEYEDTITVENRS